MLDQVQVRDSERVGREDFEAMAALPIESVKSVGSNFILGAPQFDPASSDHGPGTQNRPRSRIISGFKLIVHGTAAVPDTPIPANKQLRINRGRAILGVRDSNNQPSYGVVTAEGDAQKILDMSSFADGTYGVWVRFELEDGAYANRLFWDPQAGKEFVQNVPTRRVANWGITTVLGGGVLNRPGPEWEFLGDAVIGGGILAVTPKRMLYFEGDETTGYAQPWGSADDRNNDRSKYGLQDLYAFSSAVLQKIKEIQGGGGWWGAPPVALDTKITKTGDSPVGAYIFNTGSVTIDATSSLSVDGPADFQGAVRVNGTSPAVQVKGSTQPFLHLQETADAAHFGDLFYNVAGTYLGLRANADIKLMAGGVSSGNSPVRLDATHVYPENTTPAIELGKSTNYWLNAYTDTQYVKTGIKSGNGGVSQIGEAAKEFNAYLNDIHVAAAGRVTGDFVPVDTTRHLGSVTLYWNNVYSNIFTAGTINGFSGATPDIPKAGIDTISPATAGAGFTEILGNSNGGVVEALKVSQTDNLGRLMNFRATTIGGSDKPISTSAGGGTVTHALKISIQQGSGAVTERWIQLKDSAG